MSTFLLTWNLLRCVCVHSIFVAILFYIMRNQCKWYFNKKYIYVYSVFLWGSSFRFSVYIKNFYECKTCYNSVRIIVIFCFSLFTIDSCFNCSFLSMNKLFMEWKYSSLVLMFYFVWNALQFVTIVLEMVHHLTFV